MSARKVVIKKYENRRLYDTSNSSYVNLEDIAQMVREGTDVQVIDVASGEDITRLVLTQIIAENAKGADSTFPLDMLRQMVIASGRVGGDGLMGYMKAMSEMYQNTFRAFAPAASPFDFPPQHFGPQRAPEPPADAASQQSAPATVEELRRRVEELERMMEQHSGKGSGKTKRTGREK